MKIVIAACLLLFGMVIQCNAQSWAPFMAAANSCGQGTLVASPSCDQNGWTVLTPSGSWCAGQSTSAVACTPATTDTRIIYVSTSGTDTSSSGSGCGTLAAPCATASFAFTLLRNGSPDWVLMKCGDHWTNSYAGNLLSGANYKGKSTTEPMVWSSYDAGAANNPPVPDPYTCSARPLFTYDHTTAATGITVGDNFAVIGLKFYASSRDPANTGGGCISPCFTLTDAEDTGQAISGAIGMATKGVPNPNTGLLLIEDNWIGFFDNTGINISNLSQPPWTNPLLIRRNVIVNQYPAMTSNASDGILGTTTGTLYGEQIGTNIYYENFFDHNSWWPNANGITWAAPKGTSHQLYQNGSANNGDYGTIGNPMWFNGNIMSNEGSESVWRLGGNIQNNFWVHGSWSLDQQQANNFTSSVDHNVTLDGNTSTGAGMAWGARYAMENIQAGSANITNNIVANGPNAPTNAIVFQQVGGSANSPANGNTVTNNYIYNWNIGSPSNAYVPPPITGGANSGAVCGVSISNQGSGYASNSLDLVITGAHASDDTGTFAPGSPVNGGWGQVHYVVLTVASNTSVTGGAWVYTTAGNLTGPYTAVTPASDTTHIVLQPAFANAGADPIYSSLATYTGGDNLHYGYYNTTLNGNLSGTGFQADLFVVGGKIVYAALQSSDLTSTNELDNSPGIGYVVSPTPETMSIPALGGSGSGGQLTVTQLCNNTAAAASNYIDAAGTNSFGWPDPGRTTGSYYADKIAGATANSTLTASIDAGGVLHVTAQSGASLSLGDAIKGGLSKNDYIRGNSSTNSSLCNVAPNNANCTGTGGTGTYALTGLNLSVSSGSMSAYNYFQLVTLIYNQSKQSWSQLLRACNINAYIQAGYGVTPLACATPN